MKKILIILSLLLATAFAEKKGINDFKGTFKILNYQEKQPEDAHKKFFENSVFIKATYIGNKEAPDWIKKKKLWIESTKGTKVNWEGKTLELTVSKFQNGRLVTACFTPLDILEKINKEKP